MSHTKKIAIGSDHAGLKLKNLFKKELQEKGYDVLDCGTNSEESVDYPDYAKAVAQKVSSQDVEQGILICGTGIGMSITANKFQRVKAALAATPYMAKMARAHNNANVLCVGARVVDQPNALEILRVWLQEPFEGGRHERRVEKILKVEKELKKDSSCC